MPRWRPAELEVPGAIAVADAVQPLGEQRRGDDGLEASSPAALAQRALVVDDDVADLAGRELVADEQLATDDDAGADATADADEQQVLGGRLQRAVLGEHRGVGVVGDVAGHVDGGGELGGQRFVGPLHVGCGQHDAVVVDDAGCRAADAQQRAVEAAGDVAGEPHDRGRRLLAGLAVARLRVPGDDLAGEVHDGGFDHVVVAEIEGDDVAAVGLDAQQRGRLAGAGAGLAPDLGDQPVGDQLGGDRRDGRGGEAAVAGEVGAALRAIGVQGLQQQRAVAWTGVRGRCLRRRAERPLD